MVKSHGGEVHTLFQDVEIPKDNWIRFGIGSMKDYFSANDILIYKKGEPDTDVPSNPINPNNPSNPSNPADPSNPTNPSYPYNPSQPDSSGGCSTGSLAIISALGSGYYISRKKR